MQFRDHITSYTAFTAFSRVREIRKDGEGSVNSSVSTSQHTAHLLTVALEAVQVRQKELTAASSRILHNE